MSLRLWVFNLVLLLCTLLIVNSLRGSVIRPDQSELSTDNVVTNQILNRTSRSLQESTCKLGEYKKWKSEDYRGTLVSDANFWRYQTQSQIKLTNELALEMALDQCTRLFNSLYYYRAGRMGPINIQDSYKIMCRAYCLENDRLHEEAMATSGCSCAELSTQKDDPAWTKEGDWCYHNSARLLCDIVGYCGVWNCRIDDFMCPRYEWNKKTIPLKGPGTCIRGAAGRSISSLSILNQAMIVLACTLAIQFM
jgi:hypothetical protein